MIAFTGAGISKPSGIPTFAERPDLRDALSLEEWRLEPEKFWTVIEELYSVCTEAEPNAAHYAIGDAGIPVITQNIDGLHQRAGTEEVIELHGNIYYSLCLQCRKRISTEQAISQRYRCNSCGAWLKPDIVLYSESVTRFPRALKAVENTDLLLVVGTSLAVYPAASLPEFARRRGIEVIVINEAADTNVPKFFDERRRKAADVTYTG